MYNALTMMTAKCAIMQCQLRYPQSNCTLTLLEFSISYDPKNVQ